MADFNFYVNRQGIRGRKGEQGEQGFSPIISVKTQTANEYVLTVQNEDGSFDTPNLRGNAIANTGGTYIRYNQETGEMYTGYADIASTAQEGVVQFSTYAQLESGGDESLVTSSMDVYDFVNAKISETGAFTFDKLASTLMSGSNITLDVDDENETITINSSTDMSDIPSLSGNNTYTGVQTYYTRSGSESNTIHEAIRIVNYNDDAILIGRNAQGQSLIGTSGNQRLRIGTDAANYSAVDFYQTSTTYFPSVVIAGVSSDNINTGDDTQANHYPLFNELNFNAGSGINITHTGTGDGKQYTISSTVDLTNYVTLNTTQTITGAKTFSSTATFEIMPKIKGTTSSNIQFVDNNNTETARIYSTNADSKFTVESKGDLILKNNSKSIDLADILTTSEITTTIGSQSTDSEVPSAAAVYNALNNVGTVSKITDTNSLLTESGGYATMTISNTLGTDEVNVSVYQIGVSSNTQVYPTVEVNSSTISVTFPASADIPADTYKVVIMG